MTVLGNVGLVSDGEATTVCIQRASGVIAESSGDREVILSADGDTMITLNPVGGMVWRELPATRPDLIVALSDRFPAVARSQLTADLDAFIDDIVGAGLAHVSHADG